MICGMSFLPVLFSVHWKITKISAAVTEGQAFFSLCAKGTISTVSPFSHQVFYFIQGNKYTRVFLVCFHSAAVPLKRSFYVKPFCTNYSSWLLTGWCWNSIWNPDFGIQSAFCFCVNGIPELFYPLTKKFFWLCIISTGSGPTACQMSDFYPLLVKLEQLWHNTHLHPEVFQPTFDSWWHSEESNERSSRLCCNKQGNHCSFTKNSWFLQ